MAVTKIKDLKKYKDGVEVQIPGFIADEPITVKLKRVSFLNLVSKNKIPNELLGAVNRIFIPNQKNDFEITIDLLKENKEVFRIIAEDSLVEPTYQEFVDNDLELTEEQLYTIYEFSHSGVRQLESFRNE